MFVYVVLEIATISELQIEIDAIVKFIGQEHVYKPKLGTQ